MTVNLSGGREGLSWGLDLSSADPGQFLGDLANDPAVASLLNNSFSTSLSPTDSEAFKVKKKATDSLREFYPANEEDRLTAHCEAREREGAGRSTGSVSGATVDRTHCSRTRGDLERVRTRTTSNGWNSRR